MKRTKKIKLFYCLLANVRKLLHLKLSISYKHLKIKIEVPISVFIFPFFKKKSTFNCEISNVPKILPFLLKASIVEGNLF